MTTSPTTIDASAVVTDTGTTIHTASDIDHRTLSLSYILEERFQSILAQALLEPSRQLIRSIHTRRTFLEINVLQTAEVATFMLALARLMLETLACTSEARGSIT